MAGKRAAQAETLGNRIRRFRVQKGLTQTELGKKIGVSQRVVTYYELKGSPPPELLVKIADVLDVSTDTLLGRKAPRADREGSNGEGVRRLRRLKRIEEKLEELPLHDRKAVLKIIDALVERKRREKRSA